MAKREPRDMIEVVSRAAYPELWRMIDQYWDDDDWNGMAAQQAGAKALGHELPKD